MYEQLFKRARPAQRVLREQLAVLLSETSRIACGGAVSFNSANRFRGWRLRCGLQSLLDTRNHIDPVLTR
ncbi:hypothetical protein [Paraburkholderia sp. BL6669N2]|uniref:hypothetical protein n=1 Tax=Paraburkholderia sp. BL6669N2 TaxID=1938807 RepID=UPI0015F277D4|nr:hypothetical protein [Paraburkholderia sp. BL6669N2]